MLTIPFEPSDNNIKLAVPIGNSRYVFYHRWNDRDQAWYLDLYQEDFTPILLGIKLVLGSHIGLNCTDAFFDLYSLSVIDTSGSGIDAGFDDLGARVILVLNGLDEFSSFQANGSTDSAGG